MMTLPVAFYAEPRLRASSPGFERLKAAIELAPGTPETSLALAIDYYQTEAFSTKVERDEACGPTGHADIRYFPINRSALLRAGDTIDTIACGHDIDHPRFEQIFAPLLPPLYAVKRKTSRRPAANRRVSSLQLRCRSHGFVTRFLSLAPAIG